MIFILSGPSGSGKTTLRDRLLKDHSLKKNFIKSVSITTRKRRSGEKNGRDYVFVGTGEFRKLKGQRKILEWTKYLGYYYGTKKDTVTAALRSGKNIVLCLDHKGMCRVKKLYPHDTVSIFVIPPSIKELRKRINGRACGTREAEVSHRIRLAAFEIKNAPQYDYAICNKNLTLALKRLKGIILNKLKS